MIVLICVTNVDLFVQQLSVKPVLSCLLSLTGRWIDGIYCILFFLSLGASHMQVCLSIHPPVSFYRVRTHTHLNYSGKKKPIWGQRKRTTLMSNVPKSSLHYKFQAYDCHKTAPTVKVTILYNFPACEISLTLEISTVWKQQNGCNFRLDICVPLENMAAMFFWQVEFQVLKPNVTAGSLFFHFPPTETLHSNPCSKIYILHMLSVSF